MNENHEKTEPASKKKLDRAKREGLYPRSREVFRFLLIGLNLGFIKFGGPILVEGLKRGFVDAFEGRGIQLQPILFPLFGFFIFCFLLSFCQKGKKPNTTLVFILCKFCIFLLFGGFLFYRACKQVMPSFDFLWQGGVFLWLSYGLVALADLFIQRRRFMRGMMMTKEEVKEEAREENTNQRFVT